MRRTTISLEPQIAEGGENKAASEGRSFSSYVGRLIARDLGMHAEPLDASRLSAVTAALRRDPSAITAVETTLARRARRQRGTRRAA